MLWETWKNTVIGILAVIVLGYIYINYINKNKNPIESKPADSSQSKLLMEARKIKYAKCLKVRAEYEQLVKEIEDIDKKISML